MADDDSALWLAADDRPPLKRLKRRQPATNEIEALFNGLDAAVFQDDQEEDGFIPGSAEVPAESQGECNLACDQDEEQYWGVHTQEEDQLLIQATQAYESQPQHEPPINEGQEDNDDMSMLDASAMFPLAGGFQTGAGKSIAGPSSQAQRKAQHLLQSSPPPQDLQLLFHHSNDDQVEEDDEDSQNLMPPPPVPFHHHQHSDHEQEQERADASMPAFEISFKSARGGTLAGPSEEAMARAKRLLEPSPSPQSQPPTPSPASQHERPVQSTPNAAVAASAAHTPLRPSPLLHRQQPQLGNKTPHLTPATPRPPHPLRLMPPPQTRSSSPLPQQPQRTPQLNRQPPPDSRATTTSVPRVQSQMHGCATRQVPRKQFKTPFKNGVRPPPGSLLSSSQQRPSPARHAGSNALVVRSANNSADGRNDQERQTSGALVLSNGQALSGARFKQAKYRPVFDIFGSEGERIPWRDAGLVLGLSSVALEALGISEDVLYMDSRSGLEYSFRLDNTSKPQGWREAVDDLRDAGATLVDETWVKNHWALILWKLAGIAKATVASDDAPCADVWTYQRVLEQLLYRYEREVNQAQRSAVKRIQEHDSSPAATLVLVVSRIFWKQPALQLTSGSQAEDDGGSQERHHPSSPLARHESPRVVGLELTDGWYRINAEIDPVLEFAAGSGRLSVGQKVITVGAKLEAEREGSDVLEAQDKSHLILSANSTKKAAWDARLGFQPKALHVASLRSLSALGGVAALIDIVVVKLYPIGFMENGEEGWEKGAWNMAEEEEQQRLWQRARAAAEETATENLQRQEEELQYLCDDLTRASKRAPPDGLNDVDADDFIETLLESKSQRQSLLAKHSQSCLIEVAAEAKKKCDTLRTESHEALVSEVDDLCPPREIRTFRVARVRDANHSRNQNLEAQLTIYNPLVLEEIEERKRYLVSNVRPARVNGWGHWDGPTAEIFLSAGRASKFMPKPLNVQLLSF